MTIKEVEARAGIPRATIRYYEQEGLLRPRRAQNGYRDYSEADLADLKKILLLRELQVSLEEIRSLQHGEKPLDDILSAKLQDLERDMAQNRQASAVCRSMLEAHAAYSDLNAEKYLAAIRRPVEGATPPSWAPAPITQTDQMPPVVAHPWRRYLARSLDIALYSAAWDALLTLAFRVNLANLSLFLQWFYGLFALLLMLFVEPLLLRLFGTTPGKWLFGLHLETENGAKPSYIAGLVRTWKLLSSGLGFSVPILSLVLLWKARKRCLNGLEQPWEYDVYEEYALVYTIRDTRPWRAWAYAGATGVLCFLLVLVTLAGRMPPNRGELTIAEFAENYNAMAKYYQVQIGYRMDQNGHLARQSTPETDILLYFEDAEPEDFTFTLSDAGYVTGIHFSRESDGLPLGALSVNIRLQLAALAYVGAQRECSLFSRAPAQAATVIGDLGEHQLELAGVTLHYSYQLDNQQEIILFSLSNDP